jgi:hypothetical protein
MKKSLLAMAVLGAYAGVGGLGDAEPVHAPHAGPDCDGCTRKNPEGSAKHCSEWRYRPAECVFAREKA